MEVTKGAFEKLKSIIENIDSLLAKEGIETPVYKVCAESRQGFGIAYGDDEATNKALHKLSRENEKYKQLLEEGLEIVESFPDICLVEDRPYFLSK